ncbi:MAG: hypothetical protein SVX43_23045 [Cyanobacteriota bacterium]|nr:hypothetical protein [Cyanobacteriota bacterium]
MKSEEQAIVEMLAEYATIFGVDETRTWDVRVVLPYYAEPAMMIDRDRGVIPLPSHAEVTSLFQIGVDKLIDANFARTESPAITAKLLSETIGIAHALNIRYRQDGSEMQRFGTTYSLNKQDERWKIVAITVHDYDPALASLYETKLEKKK